MKSTSRFILMAAVLLMTLAMSAFWTVPAFADDGAPPPTEPVVEEVTPVEPPVDTEPVEESAPAEEVAPIEEVVPAEDVAPIEEVAPVDESLPAEEPAPVEESAPEADVTLPELIEQLPEGTDIIVSNEAGETVPLATEEAAVAIVEGDPIWCPAGVAPKASTNGCSPSFDSFTNSGLMNWLSTNTVSKAGVIWVAYNYNSALETGAIDISPDTTAGTSMEYQALTIQGGWNGTPGSTGITTTPSTFTVPLSITGWIGAVTIKNIVIDGAAIQAPTATANAALTVDTAGNVLLDKVTVTDSTYGGMTGAYLDNTSGAASNVTINNGAFNGNDGNGLEVYSKGIVLTNNTVANGNSGAGVKINNSTAATSKPVTMKGFKQFNDNGAQGLYIESRGLITLLNVTANNNTGDGVYIDNTASAGNLGVTFNGTSYFTQNGGDGLHILSHGAITVNNLNAMYNTGSGAILDNCDDFLSDGTCDAPLVKPVLAKGVNYFNFNYGSYGLHILSRGLITVNKVTAENNTGSGVVLDNANNLTGAAGINVLGPNYFSDNGDVDGAGLMALSHGAIVVSSVTAFGNSGIGAYLNNCDGLAGSSSTTCTGTIAKPVTIKGVNSFNWNNSGLAVYSLGAITMSNITASNNVFAKGAEIHNNTNTIAGIGSIGAVNLTGYGIFNSNKTDGLNILSHGSITATNLTANSNDMDGAQLVTSKATTTALANVTLKGVNNFNNNYHSGLSINAEGIIAIHSLTANENGNVTTGGHGVYLVNSGSTLRSVPATAVKLTGYVNVNENWQYGLYIQSSGIVTTSNISAYGNGAYAGDDTGDGVYIINTWKNALPEGNVLTPQNVTLLGTNTFNNNETNGLNVISYGIISVSNATASYNGGVGLYLDNNYIVADDPATIGVDESRDGALLVARGAKIVGYARVSNNVLEGLYINTRGVITAINLYANTNGSDGVYFKNNYDNHTNLLLSPTAAYSQNVIISGVNTFINNTGNGLYVATYGVITISNITAAKNEQDGVHLNNCKFGGTTDCPLSYVTSAKYLLITGRNLFFNNNGDGLDFSVSGTASISNAGADLNGDTGIKGVATSTITFVCVHTYGNTGAGYNLTGSAYVLRGVASFGNGAADVPAGGIIVNLACP